MTETTNPGVEYVSDDAIAVRRRGSGPAVVFIHGNSCSGRAFEKQLEGALAKRFLTIAIDLPGHGDSRPAAMKDYSIPGHAAALVGAVSALGVEDAVFVGWSLGGHVLLEATASLPRAAGHLIFGTPPVGSFAEFGGATSGNPALGFAFQGECTDAEARALLSLFVRPGGPVPDFFLEDFRRTDPLARAGLGASAARGEVTDERALVANLAVPLGVVRGAYDAVIRPTYFDEVRMPTLWRGSVQVIADAGHSPQWETPDAFDQLVEAFARDCLKRTA